jgi:hypothetical protein
MPATINEGGSLPGISKEEFEGYETEQYDGRVFEDSSGNVLIGVYDDKASPSRTLMLVETSGGVIGNYPVTSFPLRLSNRSVTFSN